MNWRAVLVVCTFQTAWLASAEAQQSPPTIDVLFEIAGDPFKPNLSSQERENVEVAIAQELVRLCADPIAYLRWQDARTLGARAALKVVLQSERTNYGYEVFLQYVSVRGPNEKAWPRDPKYTIYQPYDSLPAHNPQQLETAVRAKIRENFANDNFRKLLHERLGSTVPITETLDFDTATQRCTLPLSWESLQAADGSVLLASFQARAPAESQARLVKIRMAPENWENQLKGRVFEFNYPPTSPLKVERALQLNDPKISESLRDKVSPTAVYMEEYVRDFRANTMNSLNIIP
jgi:hypothetical protein